MVCRETFLKIHRRLLHHLIQEDSILGSVMYLNTCHQVNVQHWTQPWIRDASQDRQPKNQSSLVREIRHIIMGQTNKDCRFQIFILTNSFHTSNIRLLEEDSKLRYVLVHNFLRKLCYGSKKWRWLNQWMISNLRVELMDQTLRYSTRELLQH